MSPTRPTSPTEYEWAVTLDPGAAPAKVRSALEKAGLRVGQVLEEIGVITGHGGVQLASVLRDVPGVADVSMQAPIDIGPPGSAIS